MSTWMVVEDEPDIYELLLAMFEMWGIEGVAFVDGEEAVAWIEEADAEGEERPAAELPELALLDMRLPGSLQGEAVGERLRKSPVLGGAAIVFITAYKLKPEEEAVLFKTVDADRILYKPLPKLPELKQIFEEAIAQRKAKAAVKEEQ